jgi:hypothetical protein
MRARLTDLAWLAVVGAGLSAGLPGLALARDPADLGGLAIPSLSSPGCQAIPYQAVAVYQRPAGQVIGQLVLDHPEWASTSSASCDVRPVMELALQGRARVPLLTREIANEHAVPAVFAVAMHDHVPWYQLRDEQGQSAWVPQADRQPWHFFSLEADLVQGLARLPETCTAQGRCSPTPDALQAMVEQAGAARPGCAANAYDIVGRVVVLPGGRHAYRVRLAPELSAAWGQRLPSQALVPTHDRQQRWTGFFFARGC